MPMITFGYDPKTYEFDLMQEFGKSIDTYLRLAIKVARNSVSHEYNVFVRGDTHPPISQNLPELEITIEYHEEWKFTPDEIIALGEQMGLLVKAFLQARNKSLNDVKIRFYILSGYHGVNVE